MELLGTFYHVSETILVNSKTDHKNLELIKDHFDDFGTESGQLIILR